LRASDATALVSADCLRRLPGWRFYRGEDFFRFPVILPGRISCARPCACHGEDKGARGGAKKPSLQITGQKDSTLGSQRSAARVSLLGSRPAPAATPE
jgi:hypothetical protein